MAIRRRADGRFETDLADGRVAISDSAEGLERMAAARRQARESRLRFLLAWKRGVSLAGSDYFICSAAGLDSVTDKNQLRPDWEVVETSIGSMSPGEGVFLAAMCSFFNSEWGQSLLQRLGSNRVNLCDISATLDQDRREVIAELFRRYQGW